jgi:hypothetical protein
MFLSPDTNKTKLNEECQGMAMEVANAPKETEKKSSGDSIENLRTALHCRLWEEAFKLKVMFCSRSTPRAIRQK